MQNPQMIRQRWAPPNQRAAQRVGADRHPVAIIVAAAAAGAPGTLRIEISFDERTINALIGGGGAAARPTP